MGWMPNSTAARKAETLIATYPAKPAATTRRLDSIAEWPAPSRYTPYETNEPTIAMLQQFAPIAVIPPSPNRMAWMISALEIAAIAAHAPSTIVATPTPTAWPVVPPGSGKLNIMMTNENAAINDSSG